MDARLESLANEFLRRYFAFHPGAALTAGIHLHDAELEDFSPEAIAVLCTDLDGFRLRAEALIGLTPGDAVEREVLFARIDGVLHEYRELCAHKHDPCFYADILSSQLNSIVIFAFAPLEERLAAVIAKEHRVAAFLETAKLNLEPTAPILADYGARGMEGALSLVRRDLPDVFAGVSDPVLRADFAASTRVAAESLESFVAWLKNGYPRGDAHAYALGRARFTGWLAAAERITTSPEELERWGLAAIAETRDALIAEAARIDAKAGPAEVVERVTANHPRTGAVVREATRIAEEVYRWIDECSLVTFPNRDRVLIADTPEFMRWSFGSMWTPGPFEKAAVAATFYATDADPAWPEAKQEEHLTAYSIRGLENLAIHEAYPGHFIQVLRQNRVPSPVRKAFWWGVFGEGWAHYCEQMAVDEGFGDGNPEVRLAQLQEALTRLCRFVNCIRLHALEGWSFERGTAFFMEQAWLTEAVAKAESERAAFDPFYLRYTLGKKLILELREECRAALGSRFDLRAFHDALLDAASAPMPQMAALTRLALGVGA